MEITVSGRTQSVNYRRPLTNGYTAAMRGFRVVTRAIAATMFVLGPAASPIDAQVIRTGPSNCPAVALTYDLCPVRDRPGFDGELVEFLRRQHIPATYFLSGKWIARHDDAVKQLLAVPFFEVGTHGEVHAHLPLQDLSAQTREIGAPVARLKTGYGYDARLFRPPYGEFNATTVDVANALGLGVILWDIESGDPDPTLSAEAIVRRIAKRLKPGSIIVLHANGKGRHTRQVTQELITTVLPAKGLKPMTVSDLLSCTRISE